MPDALGEDELGRLAARLAAAAGLDDAPAVRVAPAPRGARRSTAALARRPAPRLTVTREAAARLPAWRLEAVVAHELGHLGQDRRRLEWAQGVAGGGLVATGLAGAGALAGVPGAVAALVVAAIVSAAAGGLFLADSKRLEYDADRFAAALVGGTLADHLDLVAAEHRELPGAFHLLVAHPPSRKRAAVLRSPGGP